MIKRKKGSIIFISSSAAQDGNEGRSAYASTKAAINVQSKVLISVCSLIITSTVSIYPAIKASKQDPVKALKYE